MKPQTKRKIRDTLSWPWRIARWLWAWADLDASDLHYYPGVGLVSGGLWLVWRPLSAELGLGIALVALGIGLVYPAVRRPKEVPDERIR